LAAGRLASFKKTKGNTMTVLENAPELKVYNNPDTGLIVDPTDITFESLNRDTVMIRVKIRNEGGHRSNPTSVRLESAPFGAFVPWRPLATLPVPALESGESREVSVAATRPHPAPLGDFDRVPPMNVLTALDASPDESTPQPDVSSRALSELMQQRVTSRPANNPPLARRPTPQLNAPSRMLSQLLRQPKSIPPMELKRQLELIRRQLTSRRLNNPNIALKPLLSPDLWEFFGREQPHWVGNINVFVGDRAPVERHAAFALRIFSGRPNLAMFVVGGPGQPDDYAFDLVGLPSDWKAALYNRTAAKTLVVRPSDIPIQERQWVQSGRGRMGITLAVHPPVACEEGKVQIHVTRQSCGKTAVVEFNLDPAAQGPGCYTV
jgi:hypothetical protein